MTETIVRFENVGKRFGDFIAVQPMSLEIYKGEFVAIMGSSGCGKTTTLRMLAGLEAPTEGQLYIGDQLMNDVSASMRDTPMVWQSLALFPFLNVRENVEFGLKMRGMDAATRKKKALDWLDRMEIGQFAERDISQLSGGQRQRVALARSLVTEPEMLLLDEPLSALDANLTIRMQGVLTELQRELGITFVYVTHSQSEAFAMADRVVIMSAGVIEQIGSPREIYHNPATQFVAEFIGGNNILSGNATPSGDTISVDSPVGNLLVKAGDTVSPAAGSEATFVVSADRVVVSEERPSADNVVEAKVISEEFVGSVVTLYFKAANGVEFVAQKQQRELEQLNTHAGTQLFLSWQADDGHIIPAST